MWFLRGSGSFRAGHSRDGSATCYGVSMEALSADDPRSAGEFRLRARLGVGGMGRVYLGMSPAGRAVAVKVVHPELARDAEFLARFRSEVAAAQAVNGIYTAQVVAAGLYDSPPWLATAYVPGPTLQQLVDERGPLPEAALWRLAAGLAEALRAVHAAGLVHRDLKPNNVLAAEDGPRVIDFGVSRALDATSVTRPGQTFGTPPFMSPEQARGHGVGAASDVFSLGGVLCFAATGRAPFGDQNMLTVLYRIVHEEPNLDGIQGGLRDLITGCLAKDPAGRPTLAQLTASLSARTEEWDGTFWPSAVTAAIRGYQGMNLNGLQQLAAGTPPARLETMRPDTPLARHETMRPDLAGAVTHASPGLTGRTLPPERREPALAAREPASAAGEPASAADGAGERTTSRRRLLTMAGGIGGVIVAGAVVGWALDRSGLKASAGQLAGDGSKRGTTTPDEVSGRGAPAGTVLWTATTGTDPLELGVAAGVVAVRSGVGKVDGLDAATGARMWTWSAYDVDLLQAQGDTIIVTGLDGPYLVQGLAASNGKQLWSGACRSGDPQLAIGGGLCVVPGATSEGGVIAYDISTGAHAWAFAFPGQAAAWPAAITAAGGYFYVGDTSKQVWQVSTSGSEVARFTAPAPSPSPLTVTDGILCGVGNGNVNGISGTPPSSLYSMDASTGRTLWSAGLGNSESVSMTAGDGVMYVSAMAGGGNSIAVTSRNARTGAAGWQHSWNWSYVDGTIQLALAAGVLLAGVRQTLCALSLGTGAEQWQVTLDGEIEAIEVAGDVAYASTSIQTANGRNESGRVYAVQL